jgi:hypothetical protein
MHGCPYTREDESWMDIGIKQVNLGNETPYSDCGNFSVSIGIPFPGHYNMDILAVYVNNKAVDIPSFQNFKGKKTYSLLDSCTSLIVVPDSVLSIVQNAIINGGGVSTRFSTDPYFQSWLKSNTVVQVEESDFNWDVLPTIGFTIASQDYSFKNITVVLGPREYIQLDATGKYCKPV